MFPSDKGTNSAVGLAFKISSKALNLNSCLAKAKKLLRSVFEMPPIGLISAEEQSYLVIYPLKASSTFADPK